MCSFIAAGATLFLGAGKFFLADFGSPEDDESSNSIAVTPKTESRSLVTANLQAKS